MRAGSGELPAPHQLPGKKGDDTAVPKAPSRGKPRAQFLLDIPAHEYKLPCDGPINATLVDLIVILPQWFRNPAVAYRMLNNGISAAVHFAILDKHRHLGLTSSEEAERARDHISDTYRKKMRNTWPNWTKAKHPVPCDWNKTAMSIANFFPEAANRDDYVPPPSIPFKNLAIGLKSLPQDDDVGDLTRALDFALRYQKLDEHDHPTDFMFPDDVQLILRCIGPTEITQDRYDEAVISRYSEAVRVAESERRKQLNEQRRQQRAAEEAAAQPVPYFYPDQPSSLGGFPMDLLAQQQMQPAVDFSYPNQGYHGMPPTGMGVLMPNAEQHPPGTEANSQDLLQWPPQMQSQPQEYNESNFAEHSYSHPLRLHPVRSRSQEAAAAVASELVYQASQPAPVNLPAIPDICIPEGYVQDDNAFPDSWLYLNPQEAAGQMDALMAANQTFDFSDVERLAWPSLQPRFNYSPDTPLLDCPEAQDSHDWGELARAARWARSHTHPCGRAFTVGDIDAVLAFFEGPGAQFEQDRS
ncbi:hypothetical protein J4E93_003446 [Alternaria ventricosa]|uniref:uncharacterized protein n=1 Tax=Alternaria ventricosa TaxID=1187951 RepID=UPI0020C56304|nr:uncharacterized protein J4E93_003446 [Alternaria ventricosa]KAI4649132.1 hypothetical protein J4E93_003446 [Alternaria ventricosa]